MTPSNQTRQIIENISRQLLVPVHDIMGGKRDYRTVAARHEAIRTIREQRPHLSTSQIARVFGLDHTTVLYALGRLSNKRPRAA